ARAVLGLYPLEAGQVLFDGRPVEEIPPAERAARTGYLPQDAYLFSGTVRDNVRLFEGDRSATPPPPQPPPPSLGEGVGGGGVGNPADTVQHSIRLAALAEDLRAFPADLETEIGELGIRVSGGQRQRIALARALAAAPHGTPGLIVLDDPFSAVDLDTEARIVAGLREAFGPSAPPGRRATLLLCSHRLAAFPQADLVVVLGDGQIVEQGTHERLMEADGLYARIFRAQRLAARTVASPATSPALEAVR
ncbi:MAG TPA: ABC transporter ATP-binding protein, partial [Chloroflexota bacterium]|nr:ABC transporter ATP-binding protein [Chloroflexota bacterium]